MRLIPAITISLAAHAALALLPAAMSAPRLSETIEVAFVIETPPPPSSPAPPPEITASPTPASLPPPLVEAKPPPAPPKPKPRPRPAAEPAPPPPDPAPPAEIVLETPAPAEERPEPAPVAAPAASSAALFAAVPPAEKDPPPSLFGTSGAPTFLKRVLPRYPRLAREMGREGTVVLALAIDAEGRLAEVEVLESAGSDFDEEALRAVRASSFRPAQRDGRPVACRAILPVKFVLKGSAHD